MSIFKTVTVGGMSCQLVSYDNGVSWSRPPFDPALITKQLFVEPLAIQAQVGVRARSTTGTRPPTQAIVGGKIKRVQPANATKKRQLAHAHATIERNNMRRDHVRVETVPVYAIDIQRGVLKELQATHMPKDEAGGLQTLKPIAKTVKET